MKALAAAGNIIVVPAEREYANMSENARAPIDGRCYRPMKAMPASVAG